MILGRGIAIFCGIEEKSAYYVGHTGKFAGRMKAHYDGKVLTTKGYEYKEDLEVRALG